MGKQNNANHERLSILYEDNWIVVIEKPSGLLSVQHEGNRTRTAQSVLEQIMRKSGKYTARHRPFVVHRLDRDTSGVMMFALTEAAQRKIMDTWQAMVTERLYVAVAENPSTSRDASTGGKTSTSRDAYAVGKACAVGRSAENALDDSGVIDDALAYNAHNLGYVPQEPHSFRGQRTPREKKFGKKIISAKTYYKIIERGETHTMFELSLDTGRKNQIRIHLASRGYPIAGDRNYHAATNPFGRLALHARTLAFVHPFTGEEMRFEIPEPEEWLDFVKQHKAANIKSISGDRNKNNGSYNKKHSYERTRK